MLFNEKLTILRSRYKLPRADLAAKLGVTEDEVQAYERGEKEPSLQEVYEIANLFNLSTDALLKTDIELSLSGNSIAVNKDPKDTCLKNQKNLFKENTLMNEIRENNGTGFVAYEYLSVLVAQNDEPLYADCYKSFGWQCEQRQESIFGLVTLKLKRDRRMEKRNEVNTLQRQCENALEKIKSLQKDKTTQATAVAISVGVAGAAFMAGATFCFLADLIVPMIPLAAVGFALWAFPYFIYKKLKAKKTEKSNAEIEKQYEVIYKMCEEANELLK